MSEQTENEKIVNVLTAELSVDLDVNDCTPKLKKFDQMRELIYLELEGRDKVAAALRTERDRMREALEYVKKLLPQDQETLDHAIAERLHELSHYLLVDIPYAIDEALTPRQEEREK